MAIPTGSTIEALSRPRRTPGAYPDGYVDTFLPALGVEPVDCPGLKVRVNAIDTLPGASWADRGATPSASALATSAADTDLRRIAGTVCVDAIDQRAASNPTDILQTATEAARIRLLRRLSLAVIEGDGVSPNIAGLKTQVTAAQTHGAGDNDPNGRVPTAWDVDKTISLVTACERAPQTAGGDSYAMGLGAYRGMGIVCNDRVRRTMQEALELLGGTPPYVMDPVLKVPVLMWNQCPVYVAPVPENETKGVGTNLTSLYVVKLRGASRVRLACLEGGDRFGIHIDDLPPPDDENTIARMIHGFYGLVVPEETSIARMDGIGIPSYIG